MTMVANLQHGWTVCVGPMDGQYHWSRAAKMGDDCDELRKIRRDATRGMWLAFLLSAICASLLIIFLMAMRIAGY